VAGDEARGAHLTSPAAGTGSGARVEDGRRGKRREDGGGDWSAAAAARAESREREREGRCACGSRQANSTRPRSTAGTLPLHVDVTSQLRYCQYTVVELVVLLVGVTRNGLRAGRHALPRCTRSYPRRESLFVTMMAFR
jgi:hypothetical protein